MLLQYFRGQNNVIMTEDQLAYLVFGIVLMGALVLDLGLLSVKSTVVTMRKALIQTIFWVALAMAFFVFLFIQKGSKTGLEYLSGYLMEWSLSIDNIFVFVLIINAFKVKEKYYGRVLMVGILMAIVFRVLFITVGVAAVERFHQLLYVFGAFLIYTGIRMFFSKEEEEVKPEENKVYRFLKRFLPIVPHDGEGRFIIRPNGFPRYTILFVVVVVLSTIDLVFALDSIPAVMGISQDRLVIYTSNIFAVLGLRSLFFLLKGAVSQFAYLQHGIAVVLIFIGIKMLGEYYINQLMSNTLQVLLSLGVILLCIGSSILISVMVNNRGVRREE